MEAVHKISAVFFDFPRYTSRTGSQVGKMLHGEFGNFTEINPYLAGTMFAVDRLVALPKIREAQINGSWIVCNRWMDSNVHQAARLKTTKEQLAYLKYFYWLETTVMGLPRADKVIFCDVSLRKALENTTQRAQAVGSGQDQVETDKVYLRRGIELYREVARENLDWIWVDCMKDEKDMKGEAEIQHKILAGLRRHKILPE